MKEITLPRLELMAAVIGARLSRTIKYSEELSNTKTYYWSDSMVALTWIKTKAAWSTFVGNRVKEICKYTEPSDWYHVPGNLNAADLPSRGCSSKMLANIKWWEGPEWLKGKPDSWPCSEVVCSIEEIKVEEKKNFVSMITCENKLMSQEFEYFSNYSQVVRMIGWILRFYKNLREKRRKVHGELSYDEVEEAEVRLLKLIQSESFVVSNFKTIRNLQIFEDESGLFRVKTKLVLGDDDNDFKYPIVLPSDHGLVVKLIEEQHRLSGHAGVQTLIGILRERYWLLKGRRSVKRVISKCVICIRDKRKSVETPFAPLPRDRIKNTAAFEVTGIDLAGPLYLKEKEKAWVVLFTCAVYRAVHLELIKSLSTDAFLMALRRFIARRGRVSVIYSDNGTNFVGTSNRLKTLNWDHIISYSTVQRIKWKFNPPTAAWWGGWWERLVRLVKELLRRNLGKASVYYEELITILCDCEAIINSRPLTYVSSDADELLPLTPSDFLQGIPRCGVSDIDEIDRISLVKRYRYVQKLRDSLRERFRKEYLAELVHYGKRKVTDIKAGDIVLVGSDNMKRINWPMGKVLEIYPGKDNLPRVARVKVVSGELIRPFQRLFPLEISSCENDEIKIASAEPKQDEEVESLNNEDYFYKTRRGRVVKKPDRFSFKE